MADPAADESPASMACTIARISAADVSALVVLEVALELLLEDAAFKAVEFSESMSSCAEVRSPFPRSVPIWVSSLTNELELLDEEAMSDSRPVVIPLAEVVAVDDVAPSCASWESVT